MTSTATRPTTIRVEDHQENQSYTSQMQARVAPRLGGDASLRPLGDVLQSLVGLDNNWDGYGAVAPSRSALEQAWAVASTLVENDFAAPQVFPSRTGGVQLEWHGPLRSLEWEIDANAATGVVSGGGPSARSRR